MTAHGIRATVDGLSITSMERSAIGYKTRALPTAPGECPPRGPPISFGAGEATLLSHADGVERAGRSGSEDRWFPPLPESVSGNPDKPAPSDRACAGCPPREGRPAKTARKIPLDVGSPFRSEE